MFESMPGNQHQRRTFATSLRAAREMRELSRETVIYRMTALGNPISVSTLARWERDGSLKVEDAYYLGQVYDMNWNELLLRFSDDSNGRDDPAATRDLADELSARAAEKEAKKRPRRRKPPPSDE